jgi:hypothetical protein
LKTTGRAELLPAPEERAEDEARLELAEAVELLELLELLESPELDCTLASSAGSLDLER